MGLQLIFVVESNKKSKSDWIYIKDTIDHFYSYGQAHTKFSPVYMNGKGNYKTKDKEIKGLVSQYYSVSKENRTEIIYCFDCDDYDIKKEDVDFLNEVRQYCKSQGYAFVWFCKDIEQVYIGRKIDNSQKTKEAVMFKKKKIIATVDDRKLSIDRYQKNTSNIMQILDSYLNRKE